MGRAAPARRRSARGPSSRHAPEQRTPIWETLDNDSLPEAVNDRTVQSRDSFFRRMLAIVDVLAMALALLASTEFIGGGSATMRPATLLLLPLVVLGNKAAGLYDRDQHQVRKTTIDDAPSLLHTSVLYALVGWLGEALFFDGPLNRGEVFGLAVSSFLLMIIGRTAARAFALSMTPAERCLVLGNAGSAARIASKLHSATGAHAEVMGRVSLDDVEYGDIPGAAPTLGHIEGLGLLLVTHEVERVIIAPDGHDQEQILNAIRLIKAMGVKVSVLPRLLEVVGSSSTFDEVDGITLLGVRQYGLSDSSAFLKRAVDVSAAAVGIVVLAPLLAVLAAAVWLESRGTILFRQPRIGRSGREFAMLKFRSMVPDAEAMKDSLRDRNESQGLFKIEKDPRITRVGRFLRKTSLDELPQLFNVLRGDMSLVGPRPLVPAEDAMIEGWQRRRLAVKPGMTGLWQIFGSSRIPMAEMVKIDYLYGANWSLWLDLKILLRTVPYVLSRRGL
jgi:exopolysaccharide biosynthesis polyprenyl glycosylphosphotransferase